MSVKNAERRDLFHVPARIWFVRTNLWTELLKWGGCGGGFTSVGRDYVAILDLLKERLMDPQAVAAFTPSDLPDKP